MGRSMPVAHGFLGGLPLPLVKVLSNMRGVPLGVLPAAALVFAVVLPACGGRVDPSSGSGGSTEKSSSSSPSASSVAFCPFKEPEADAACEDPSQSCSYYVGMVCTSQFDCDDGKWSPVECTP